MGVYHSVCRTCEDELVTTSVTDARQYTRAHRERGHDATVSELADETAPVATEEDAADD